MTYLDSTFNNVDGNIDYVDLIFRNIHESLDKISDERTFDESHELIIEAALKIELFSRRGCFTVTYQKEIPERVYLLFLKAMEIKARDATGIVPSIDSCKLKAELPMGFTRIIKIGTHEAIQRVWVNKKENEFKIIFKSDGLKFIATNELKKENNKIVFTARYIVADHPRYKTSSWFLDKVMDPTFNNLQKLSFDNNLNEKYKAVVIGQRLSLSSGHLRAKL